MADFVLFAQTTGKGLIKRFVEMKLTIKIGTASIDWQAVCKVLEEAPLGRRDPEILRKASEKSYVVCTAYSGERLVGFCRALSDGHYQSAIYDLAVLPEFQRQGAGSAIMKALLAELPRGNIIFYTQSGMEAFFNQFGFWRLDRAMVKLHNH